MHLLFTALVLGTFRTAVSAVPLTHSIVAREYLDLEARGQSQQPQLWFPPEFHETKPTALSLGRYKVGSNREHWGLHLHEPIKGDHMGEVMGTAISAIRQSGDHPTAPLTTATFTFMGAQAGDLSHVANIPEGKHMEAIDTMRGVHCKEPPTKVNCVDWTKHAVTALHDKGLISQQDKNRFHVFHEEKHAAVRQLTDSNWKAKSSGGQGSGSGSPKHSGSENKHSESLA